MSDPHEWVAEWHEGVQLWMDAEHPDAWREIADLNRQIDALMDRRDAVYASLPQDVRNTLSMRGAISGKPMAYVMSKQTGTPVDEILAQQREFALNNRPGKNP